MAKKALITGITGQDGAYLSQLLLENGYEVHGGVRRISHSETVRLVGLGIDQDITFHDFDLSEQNSIVRAIREGQYDEVYNLAAQSFVGSSWDQPLYTSDVNSMGTLRILDAIRTYSPHSRFYQASTSEMYGLVQEVPQREDTPLYPRSPYGVAKVFGHLMTRNYRESFGLHGSSGILFNHESPLRGEEFVTRKITMGLARIAHGSDRPIELGNMDAKRDWGYAKDYVRGMYLMLQQDEGDEYVLATGRTHTIREFATWAAAELGMTLAWEGEGQDEVARDTSSGKTIIKVNPAFYRPAEVDLLVGNASKARDKLGWEAEVSVEELARMMARSDYDAAT
ncbi:MAG: GDP-mannose 4,6-dehydratase [Rhodobacteraceae bacterium]|nr:GDP-mannose 4,6-dehydratase [Paracoccaceae bacterium]